MVILGKHEQVLRYFVSETNLSQSLNKIFLWCLAVYVHVSCCGSGLVCNCLCETTAKQEGKVLTLKNSC